MFYIFIILTIIYTICSCLDGPDLKPKWKHWLGEYMHNTANNYSYWDNNINFCLPELSLPKYEPAYLKAVQTISEYDLRFIGYEKMVDYAKQNCIREITHTLLNNELIVFEEVKNPMNGTINIIAKLCVDNSYGVNYM